MHQVHTLRAETPQEAADFNRVRMAFLSRVLRDSRTSRLFEWWVHHYHLETWIASAAGSLDRAAARAGVSGRGEWRPKRASDGIGEACAIFSAVPDRDERQALQEFLSGFEELLDVSRTRRTLEAIGFVVAGLYGAANDEDVPVRAWLADDLVAIFDEQARSKFWDTPCRLKVGLPDRIAPETLRGVRGKTSSLDIADSVECYYRIYVAQPRVSAKAIARERAVGQVHYTRRNAGSGSNRDQRPDESPIAYRVAKIKRLLELPVPPELRGRIVD